MNKQEILYKINKIYNMWKSGKLGGEFMPEDYNPKLIKSSRENYLFFTLPMALNYQRNSYKLWESATLTFNDKNTSFIFYPDLVLKKSKEEIMSALTKYKLALQKNKQTDIWISLCKTLNENFNNNVENLLKKCNFDIKIIKKYIQIEHKKDFPYLSGNKICNYWLYVLSQYTDAKFKNLDSLTIAPDTHIIQASKKLGLISEDEFSKNDIQLVVAKRWENLLPIEIHTPLCLWSRNGFKNIE